MKGPGFLRGLIPIGRHEFLVNLRSIRMLIMIIILALVVVGGAYGIGRGPGGGGGPSGAPFALWPHPAQDPSGNHLAVVWVSDPFGSPLGGSNVVFSDLSGPQEEQIATVSTDTEGFARLDVGTRMMVFVEARVGNAGIGMSIPFDPPLRNFSVAFHSDDLDNDGLVDDLGVHVVTLAGQPAVARLYVNDTYITTVDSRGYGLLEIPRGGANVTAQVAGENYTSPAFAFERPSSPPPFQFGPDLVLLLMASFFVTFVVPIFATVMTFDAVSKERVQGTIDLLLSRPASRIGTLLGKFLGTLLAVALPVTLVNLVGVGVLTVVSGKSPTRDFVLAFLGLSLVLIAFYMPVQLTFSTLAKTSGTAILFGILVWLAFTVLYPVITLVLSSLLFPNNFALQFRFTQYAGLANPNFIYTQLVTFAAPESIRFQFGGGSIHNLPVIAAAGVVWFGLTLALAIWTFHRKAAD